MKYSQSILFALSLLVIASACSSSTSLKFKHDFDSSAPFESFTTYKLVEPSHEIKVEMDIMDKNYFPFIEGLIKEQMEVRGYKESENADLLVTYFVTGDDFQKAQYNTVSVGVGFGGPYGGVGFSNGNTNVNYVDYTQGTLIIDMYDKDKELIWHGSGEGTYRPDKTDPKKLTIYAVKSVFKRYKYKVKS